MPRGRGRPLTKKAGPDPPPHEGSDRTKSKGSKNRLKDDEGIKEQMRSGQESQTLETEAMSEKDGTEGSTNDLDPDLENQQILEEIVDKVPCGRKPWVDVIRDNRVPKRGSAMDFEAPSIVDGEPEVEILDEDVQSEVEFWKAGLILFAVGRELTMNAVKVFMEKVWNFVSLPELYYHEQGYFLVRFKNVEDREEVIGKGPYYIFSSPVFICKWSPDFVIKEDLYRLMPIWVKFPNLPLHFWGDKALSKIASAVGRPLSTDECTAKKLRVSYARVLVEVDITQERRQDIRIKDRDGTIRMQRVVYEGIPKFCTKCQKIGHSCEEQQVPKKNVWIQKKETNKKMIEEAIILSEEKRKGESERPGSSQVKENAIKQKRSSGADIQQSVNMRIEGKNGSKAKVGLVDPDEKVP